MIVLIVGKPSIARENPLLACARILDRYLFQEPSGTTAGIVVADSHLLQITDVRHFFVVDIYSPSFPIIPRVVEFYFCTLAFAPDESDKDVGTCTCA
jgi:hypothetical protein